MSLWRDWAQVKGLRGDLGKKPKIISVGEMAYLLPWLLFYLARA